MARVGIRARPIRPGCTSRDSSPANEPLPPVVTAAPSFDEPLPPRLARVLPPARRAAPPSRADKPATTDTVIAPPSPRLPRRQAARPAAPTLQAPLEWALADAEPVQLSAPLEPAAQVPSPSIEPEMSSMAPEPETSILEPEPEMSSLAPEPESSLEPAPEVSSLEPEPEPTWEARPPSGSTVPFAAASAPSWPAHPTWPPPRPADAVEPVEPLSARAAAGSYLPPSAVLPPGEILPLPGAERRLDPDEVDERPRREKGITNRIHVRLGDGTGPLGMAVEVPARIVVLGATLAGLGFLLPWARVVIGGQEFNGYLAQWGLAGPGHLVILGLVVGLAILALIADRTPRWVRLGLPSIALAFLLTGLLWPYLVGNFQASIGVYVVALGAIIMIAGGLLDRVVTRHAESAATV